MMGVMGVSDRVRGPCAPVLLTWVSSGDQGVISGGDCDGAGGGGGMSDFKIFPFFFADC